MNSRLMLSARVRTVRVFAKPGTPSKSTCPLQSSPIRTRSSIAFWPTITLAASWVSNSTKLLSWLTEELVEQGHQVTLVASGDSITSANLVAGYPHSLREQGSRETLAPHILMLEEVFSRAHEFDVLHFHINVLQYPLSRRQQTPHLTTLHGRLDFPELYSLYRKFRQIPVASISDSQRKQLPWLNWRATVHHGMPKELFGFRPKPGAYLAFLGRISPEKRADWAIQIAQRAGIPLRIAAKVDEADRPYFKREIELLLKGSNAEFIGEIGDSEKERFLGGADAFLLPVD